PAFPAFQVRCLPRRSAAYSACSTEIPPAATSPTKSVCSRNLTLTRFKARFSRLPDCVALLAQRDGELDLHVARGLVGHRVGIGVELGEQAQAEALHVAVGADASLVLREAFFGAEAGHADVDAGLEEVAVGVRVAKARDVEDRGIELDHVDVVMVLAPHWQGRKCGRTRDRPHLLSLGELDLENPCRGACGDPAPSSRISY